MRCRALRAALLIQLLAGAPLTRADSAAPLVPEVEPAARQWMQDAMDTWGFLCDSRLHLEPEPLPWLIFYDEQAAWHVAPDHAALPAHTPAGFTLRFAGREIPVKLVRHSPAGELWLPERSPMPVSAAKILAAPYAGGVKSFCICALPALVQRSLGNESDAGFPQFLLGIVGHEMAHTRQVSAVSARFHPLEQEGVLPDSFDDNIVESTFGSDAEYARTFSDEVGKLMHAALQDDDPVSGRRLIREALAMARERHSRYFAGPRAVYAVLDDTFLSMEGIGQWVHFQVLRRSAPVDEPWQQTAIKLIQRSDSWVQSEGFALFLLIDRYVPGWQQQFFAADFPSPFRVLETAISAISEDTIPAEPVVR